MGKLTRIMSRLGSDPSREKLQRMKDRGDVRDYRLCESITEIDLADFHCSLAQCRGEETWKLRRTCTE